MIKVIGISGSHRIKGNTEIALEKVLNYIRDNEIETELISLADKNIKSCAACDRCRIIRKCIIRDDFYSLYDKLEKCEGIIFGCPVYNFAPTSKLLNFRTRLSRIAHCNGRGEKMDYKNSGQYISKYPHPSSLKRKVGGSIVICRRGGADLVLAQMNSFFLAHEMFIVGSGYINILYGYHKGDILKDNEGIRNILTFAENFKWLVKKVNL